MKRYNLDINGMTCEHCVAAVSGAIRGIAGVTDVNVDLAAKKASIVFDERQRVLSQLIDAVRTAGYDVRGFREAPLDQPVQPTEPSCPNSSPSESTE